MLLSDEPFAYAEWKRCRVGLDYHVEIGRHHYSVPSALVRQEVEARVTDATVETFLRGKRVASHLRSTVAGRATTVSEHMPSSHRRHREWTHDKIRREAARMGADAATLIDAILEGRPHPEQGFRSAIGIIGLARRHGPERVDAACARAIALGSRSYGSVARILSNRAEALTPLPTEAPVLVHANSQRGSSPTKCSTCISSPRSDHVEKRGASMHRCRRSRESRPLEPREMSARWSVRARDRPSSRQAPEVRRSRMLTAAPPGREG